MPKALPRLVLGGLTIILLVAALLAGCTVQRTPQPTAAGAETTNKTTNEAVSEVTLTEGFKVELPVTTTPTQAAANAEGTPLPTRTPAPTSTQRPTKTPWPTKAPTSAPAQDANMVYIPGGEFTLGADGGPEDQSPAQAVMVDPFNLDKYPVTNAEYQLFVKATGHRAPRHWTDGAIPAGLENHPVVWVTWEDANAYAAWAGKRLPTEIEWEKAARGEDSRLYPWGNTFDSANCNSREANLKVTNPVGQYPGGASPYGAEELCGNVWEWTANWYQAYRGSVYSLERYGEVYRVLRGGSWFDGADAVTATTRNSAKPSFMFSTIGFRCAK
jgi:formylglycine-generating enzyme required for sulfatase activity